MASWVTGGLPLPSETKHVTRIVRLYDINVLWKRLKSSLVCSLFALLLLWYQTTIGLCKANTPNVFLNTSLNHSFKAWIHSVTNHGCVLLRDAKQFCCAFIGTILLNRSKQTTLCLNCNIVLTYCLLNCCIIQCHVCSGADIGEKQHVCWCEIAKLYHI